MFSFQSISLLSPKGLPPAQAASNNSSLSSEEVALQNQTKAVNSWILSSRDFSFHVPPSSLGRGKAREANTGCLPLEPTWKQGPRDEGKSHQQTLAVIDEERGKWVQARRVPLRLRKAGESFHKFPVSLQGSVVRTRKMQSGDSLLEGMTELQWMPVGIMPSEQRRGHCMIQ